MGITGFRRCWATRKLPRPLKTQGIPMDSAGRKSWTRLHLGCQFARSRGNRSGSGGIENLCERFNIRNPSGESFRLEDSPTLLVAELARSPNAQLARGHTEGRAWACRCARGWLRRRGRCEANTQFTSWRPPSSCPSWAPPPPAPSWPSSPFRGVGATGAVGLAAVARPRGVAAPRSDACAQPQRATRQGAHGRAGAGVQVRTRGWVPPTKWRAWAHAGRWEANAEFTSWRRTSSCPSWAPPPPAPSWPSSPFRGVGETGAVGLAAGARPRGVAAPRNDACAQPQRALAWRAHRGARAGVRARTRTGSAN